MDGEPLVSVIVPAYNHEKFIGQCIESIMNQSYENIELIILDDGSKDSTFNVIKSYEKICIKRFKNFIFRTKDNEGICKTLNEGIKLSTGDYITIIASDDLFLENKIQKQVKVMEINKEAMMSWTNGYVFNFNNFNNKEIIEKNIPQWTSYNKKEMFEYFLIYGNNVNNASCMYRKKLFNYIGSFDENLNFEDWDFYLRIAYKYKIVYIHEPLVLKRNHYNNTGNHSDFMFKGDKQVLDKAFSTFSIDNIKKVKRLAYSNMYRWNAGRFYDSNKQIYKDCIKMSLKNNPFNCLLYKYLFKNNLKNITKKLVGKENYNKIKKLKNKYI